MARFDLPLVREDWLVLSGSELVSRIQISTPDWYDWLQNAASFTFESNLGTFTARKEQVRGKGYWKAYRKMGGKLYQVYLGKGEDLTVERLQEAAGVLTRRGQIQPLDNLDLPDGPDEAIEDLVIEVAQPSVPAPSTAFREATAVLPTPAATGDVMLTKLHAPTNHKNLIARPRLTGLLQPERYRLTLISAPPGFGKTTLVAEWLNATAWAHCWFSLDPQDSDPVRFWYYLAQTLEEVSPGISQSVADLFQTFSTPQLVNRLVNQLLNLSRPVVLVLDDYHVISSEEIHQGVQLLLERLPEQLHLIVTSRSDPPFPLAKMRVRGELNELRTTDLRFTTQEAQFFLNETMALNISSEQLNLLEERTEGWIAGLQLAALGMRGQGNISAFINAFRGSHRYVLDYLAEEVLAFQSEAVRNFLLQSSILERMTASLVEEITGCEDGQGMLEQLEGANLFVIALDQERRWYRYHNLFAEYLRTRLRQEQSEHLPFLHRWAADWYEEQGMYPEAIKHSLQSASFDKAAHLIEQIANAGSLAGEWFTLLEWLKAIPDGIIVERPRLNLHYVWALINGQRLDLAEARLSELLAKINPTSNPAETANFGPGSENERADLGANWQTELVATRAWLAFNQGDIVQALELTREALKGRGASRAFLRLNLVNLIEQAYGYTDKSTLARIMPLVEELVVLSQQANQPYITIFVLNILAACKRQLGSNRETYQICSQILQLLTQDASLEIYSQHLLIVHVVQALAAYYLNWLGRAEINVSRGLELARKSHNDDYEFYFLSFMARLKLAQNDQKALAQVLPQVEAKAAQLQSKSPMLTAGLVMLAQIHLKENNLAAATAWANQQEITLDAKISLSREGEYVQLARVLAAQGYFQQAFDLLEPLIDQTSKTERLFALARASLAQATILRSLGRPKEALTRLEQVLKIAEPEGLVRLFFDEGPTMGALLQTYLRHNFFAQNTRLIRFVEQLLPQLGPAESEDRPLPEVKVTEPERPANLVPPGPKPATPDVLTEPLSERELQVLKLLPTSLNTIEIARHLVVAPSTVRTHVRNIYAKLGVQRRVAAVSQARELGLL